MKKKNSLFQKMFWENALLVVL